MDGYPRKGEKVLDVLNAIQSTLSLIYRLLPKHMFPGVFTEWPAEKKFSLDNKHFCTKTAEFRQQRTNQTNQVRVYLDIYRVTVFSAKGMKMYERRGESASAAFHFSFN